jgi:hypothetical protein
MPPVMNSLAARQMGSSGAKRQHTTQSGTLEAAPPRRRRRSFTGSCFARFAPRRHPHVSASHHALQVLQALLRCLSTQRGLNVWVRV